MKRLLLRSIETIENAPLTLASGALTFIGIVLTRMTIENALFFFKPHAFDFLFFDFTHTFLFFLCSFFLFLPIVRLAGKVDFKKAANLLLFGFLIIIMPPIVDKAIFGDQFLSFYAFDGFTGLIQRYFTFFGDSPDIGITYGVRLEVALAVIAVGLYSYLKSRRVLRSLGFSLLAYSLMFLLGTLPSWITLALVSFHKSFLAITPADIVSIFLAPQMIFLHSMPDMLSVLNIKMSLVLGCLASLLSAATLFLSFPSYFFALLKNARFPQLTYHDGLFFIGAALAISLTDGSFVPDLFHVLAILTMFFAIRLAWFASVVANDIYDIRIDEQTNAHRPLIRKTIPLDTYAAFGVLFFAASLLLAGIVDFSALLLLLGYQAIAWIYSAPPLRLKRFPAIATLLAAADGTLIMLIGFLIVSPASDFRAIPLSLFFFLFAAYAVSLPIKDFKDIAGDAADHVYTLPVVFGETMAKLIIGGAIFLLFVATPFVLNERTLFIPAAFFGSLCFWALYKGTQQQTSFFSFRKMPGIILALTAGYIIVILYILSR